MTEETTQETTETTTEQNTPATRKELLAPLATYGVVAIAIVAVIITTAIMLNNELNTIESDVASLEDELAEQNVAAPVAATGTEAMTAQTVVASTDTTATEAASTAAVTDPESTAIQAEVAATQQPDSEITEQVTAAAEVAAAIEPAADVVARTATAATTDSTAPANTVTAALSRQAIIDEMKNMMKQLITEQNALQKKRDAEQLKRYRTVMSKQIKLLQQQALRTQQMIADIEKRNQSAYEMRAATMEKRQQQRDEMLNRI
jgi:uncharacterized protein YaaR (DUF327 family)